jgi:hypothetical protein
VRDAVIVGLALSDPEADKVPEWLDEAEGVMLSVERGDAVALSEPLDVWELVCEVEPEADLLGRTDEVTVMVGAMDRVADWLGEAVVEAEPDAELDAEVLIEGELVVDDEPDAELEALDDRVPLAL